jgi:hypothetical protein
LGVKRLTRAVDQALALATGGWRSTARITPFVYQVSHLTQFSPAGKVTLIR